VSYIRGLGAVASSVPFVSTPTLEGDGFSSLYAAYKSAFPAGTSLTDFTKAICAANGIPYSVPSIEAWIFGLSGRRQKLVTSGSPPNNPGSYGGPKGVGWAYFGAGNRIMLPNIPRPGVTPVTPTLPPPPPPPMVSEPVTTPSSSKLPYIVGAGLLLFALLSGDKKKQSGASLRTSTSPSVTRFKANPRKPKKTSSTKMTKKELAEALALLDKKGKKFRINPRLASDYELQFPDGDDDEVQGMYLDAEDLRSMSVFPAPKRVGKRKRRKYKVDLEMLRRHGIHRINRR
jgi:hypothetical protein